MNRRMLRNLVIVGAVAGLLTVLSSSAQAGWNHWRGSYGVSMWGGYGCWDPCCAPVCLPTYDPCCYPTYTTCYDPCAVGCYAPLSRIAYRWRTHHYNYYGCGLAGCCDPCMTGWSRCRVCWRSPCCCNPCWDPCGDPCCNGVIEGTTLPMDLVPGSVVPTPAETGEAPSAPAVPAPAPPAAAPGAPSVLQPDGSQTSVGPHDAMLTVRVPADALVYVNGAATRSQGTVRRYVSRDLTPGFQYAYELRVVTNVGGKASTETRSVHVQAGEVTQLAFGNGQPVNPETVLTLKVPANAKVFLAGNEMRGAGEVRTFRTRKLTAGQQWNDYEVRVTLDQDGQTLTRERTIALAAGQQQQLEFDFAVDKVAMAR